MKRGMALMIILGIIIVMCILALGAVYVMGNQAYVAEHKIRRTQGFYTARAGFIHAYDRLVHGVVTTVNLNGTRVNIDQDYGTMTAEIDTISGTPLNGTIPIKVKVDYSSK